MSLNLSAVAMGLMRKVKGRLMMALLYGARALGIFAFAQYLTRRRLRILCYHGFSLGDEHEVLPHVFMRTATFLRRMQILKRRGIPVVGLDDALERLSRGQIEHAETVLTFDDGWATNCSEGAGILETLRFPATIYVTTEHLAADSEVFNVILFYMLSKTTRREFMLAGVHPAIDGTYRLDRDIVAVQRSFIAMIENAIPALIDRQRLLEPIANALGFDLRSLSAGHRFRLMSAAEMLAMHRKGFHLELHTHTHRLPADSFDGTKWEIERNRQELAQVIGVERNNFCYPSGEYVPHQTAWLRRLGVSSATTCKPGLNGPETDRLQLRRFLDSDDVSDISFEAEVCGLRELVRTSVRWLSYGNVGTQAQKLSGSSAAG